MKIFYVKASVFTSSYRCSMVRQRLLRFIKSNPPLAIVVSGLRDEHRLSYHQFKQQCEFSPIRFIHRPGCYSVATFPLELSESFLRLGDLVVVPIEGTIAVIDKLAECRSTYMLFDMFADESFSDYHGELDDTTFKELESYLKQISTIDKK